ncbi:MAG: LD-carboxypeptidase [Myxococcota bacterium]|nr:LD-carboxypeptidase [Myxococcota bacterium]
MPRLVKPRALAPGAGVALAAPAFPADPERVAEGEAWLGALGYRVRRRADLTATRGYLAGDDARRAAELMQWVDDPEVAAIFCVRGGWGCHRVLPRLDAARVRSARTLLVGFSDVTTLLLWQLRRAGLAGLHGPMLERPGGPVEEEREALARALSGRPLPPLRGTPEGGGRAEGRLLGGSLTLLAASLGTPWEPRTRGAILVLEDVGEKPYALDRLLSQLRAAGLLEGLAGIGVGHLTGCTDPRRERPTALEVVREALAPLGIPFVTGLPSGHGTPNLPWPMGGRAVLDGERGELVPLEAAVRSR